MLAGKFPIHAGTGEHRTSLITHTARNKHTTQGKNEHTVPTFLVLKAATISFSSPGFSHTLGGSWRMLRAQPELHLLQGKPVRQQLK